MERAPSRVTSLLVGPTSSHIPHRNTIVDLLRYGKITNEEAKEVYDFVVQHNISDRGILRGFLVFHSKQGNAKEVQDALILSKQKHHSPPPEWPCYLAIAHVHARDFGAAQTVLRSVSVRNALVCNAYNTLVFELAPALPEKARKLLAEMRSMGIAPNAAAYSAIVRAFAVRRNHKNACSLLLEMRRYAVEPRVGIVELVLAIDTLPTAAARDLFEQLKTHGPAPEAPSYLAMLKVYDRAGEFDAAVALFGDMKAREVRPNRPLYELMMRIHGVRGDSAAVRATFADLCEIFGNPYDTNYAALISALGRAGDIGGALEVLAQVDALGARPACVNRALFSVCVQVEDAELCRELFAKMIADGSANEIVCNQMIMFLGKIGDIKGYREVFEEMKTKGLPPNSSTYNCMISLDAHDAMNLFLEMKQRGVDPDMVTYRLMIDRTTGQEKKDLIEEKNAVELWDGIVS